MTREEEPLRGIYDAMIMTPNQTFYWGKLHQFARHWEVKINLRAEAEKKIGECIPIQDVLIELEPED